MTCLLSIILMGTYLAKMALGTIPPIEVVQYETCLGSDCVRKYKDFYYKRIENNENPPDTWSTYLSLPKTTWLYFIDYKEYRVDLIEQAFVWCVKLELTTSGSCFYFHDLFYDKGFTPDLIPDYCTNHKIVCQSPKLLLVLSYEDNQLLENVVNFDECLIAANEWITTQDDSEGDIFDLLKEVAEYNIRLVKWLKEQNDSFLNVTCSCDQVRGVYTAYRLIIDEIVADNKADEYVASICTGYVTYRSLTVSESDILEITNKVASLVGILNEPLSLMRWLLLSKIPVQMSMFAKEFDKIFKFYQLFYSNS